MNREAAGWAKALFAPCPRRAPMVGTAEPTPRRCADDSAAFAHPAFRPTRCAELENAQNSANVPRSRAEEEVQAHWNDEAGTRPGHVDCLGIATIQER